MPTFRGQAVRSSNQTGETPTARRMREKARARRTPAARGHIGGLAAIRRAFPGDYDKQLSVEVAITSLRSDRDSVLYTQPKQAFLADFRAKHGIAYPYKVPVRRA